MSKRAKHGRRGAMTTVTPATLNTSRWNGSPLTVTSLPLPRTRGGAVHAAAVLRQQLPDRRFHQLEGRPERLCGGGGGCEDLRSSAQKQGLSGFREEGRCESLWGGFAMGGGVICGELFATFCNGGCEDPQFSRSEFSSKRIKLLSEPSGGGFGRYTPKGDPRLLSPPRGMVAVQKLPVYLYWTLETSGAVIADYSMSTKYTKHSLRNLEAGPQSKKRPQFMRSCHLTTRVG